MAYRWPTDPPGKAPSHTISYAQHQQNVKAKQTPTPQAPTPGVETPTVAPTPASAPPPDPLYDEEISGLGKIRDIAIANALAQRKQGLAEYGFNESDDGTSIAFDPNNPFSRAALLKRTYNENRARAGQQMASGGGLYSGAYQTQQDALNRGQLGAEDSLQKSLLAFLAKNTASKQQAGIDFQEGVRAAESDRVSRIPDNVLYDPSGIPAPAAPAAPTGTGGVGTAATKTKKPLTIKAGPNVKATKQTTVTKKRKGKTVTYTTAVKGP